MPFGLLSVFLSILLRSVPLCGTKRGNIAEFSSNNFLSRLTIILFSFSLFLLFYFGLCFNYI